MARILIIDNESKSVEEIKKTLNELNSQNITDIFSSYSEFEKYLNETKPEGQEYNLIILDYSMLKPQDWVEKIKFLKDKYKEATLCFSSYDNLSVNRKFIFGLAIFNLLYKPFDSLLLKENLNVALKPKEKISLVEVKPQSSAASVGILKEINITCLNELGFTSSNDTPIAINSYCKYYSSIFSTGNKQSVWAKCIASEPAKDQSGQFVSHFSYISLDSNTLSTIRKYVLSKKTSKVNAAFWNLEEKKTGSTKIAIIDSNPETIAIWKTNLEERFKNIQVEEIIYDASKKEFEKNVSYDLVININPALKFEAYKERFDEKAKHILINNQPLSDETAQILFPQYYDVFSEPLDRGYFYKKLKILAPTLEFKESVDLLNIIPSEKIKAVNFVKTSEVSEVYLTFAYHRELSQGEFREFAFVAENENDVIELPAFCIFCEKGQSDPGKPGNSYTHQFFFWGATDYHLKKIRVWLLHNYVLQNQPES